MRILADDDQTTNGVSLFLTGEVAELTDALENLLRDAVGSYVHVSNAADYSKDITVAVYSTDTGGSSAFRERVRRLIAKDASISSAQQMFSAPLRLCVKTTVAMQAGALAAFATTER